MLVINPDQFKNIDTIFNNNGWVNKKISKNEYIYIKNNEYDEFRIELEDNMINIISPIPNSNFLFKQTFNDYIHLCNYIEQHIINYDEKMNI
jgi:hypothetical protein